jgi:hypothetical protein
LQELRKSTGLDVSDRISVVMSVSPQRAGWARTHRDLIAAEILATSFEFGEPADAVEIGDGVRVAIAKTGDDPGHTSTPASAPESSANTDAGQPHWDGAWLRNYRQDG